MYNHQLYLDTKLEKYSRSRDAYRRKLKGYLSSASKVKGRLNTDIIDIENLSKKELKKYTKNEKKLEKVSKKKAKGENKLDRRSKKKDNKIFKKERAIQMKKAPPGKKKPKKETLESVQLKIHSKDPFGAVSLMNDKQYIEKT